jgi:hypothetical protein
MANKGKTMHKIDIAAVNALLEGTTIAPIAIPQPVKAATTDHDAKMATLKATNGQMKRVNALYREAGLREFATLRTFRKVFPTMLDASIEYRTLKAAR